MGKCLKMFKEYEDNSLVKREFLYDVLESDLGEYERIFLIINRQELNLLTYFCNSNALKTSKYKVLILSTDEFPNDCCVKYRQITTEECSMLCQFYNMYEFSDRFRIFSKENNYGSILNFFDMDILDMEDIFEAILA